LSSVVGSPAEARSPRTSVPSPAAWARSARRTRDWWTSGSDMSCVDRPSASPSVARSVRSPAGTVLVGVEGSGRHTSPSSGGPTPPLPAHGPSSSFLFFLPSLSFAPPFFRPFLRFLPLLSSAPHFSSLPSLPSLSSLLFPLPFPFLPCFGLPPFFATP